MREQFKRIWLQLISIMVIAFLIGEVVLLLKQNRDLRAEISSFINPEMMEPLKPGDHVRPIKVQSLSGGTSELSYTDPSKKYLLFVLSTTCPHCEKTFPLWRMIATNVKPELCSVVGISIHSFEETKKYVDVNQPNFNIVVVADTSFKRVYKINGVPETILIGGNGVVEKTWIGELTTEQTNEIQKLLGG